MAYLLRVEGTPAADLTYDHIAQGITGLNQQLTVRQNTWSRTNANFDIRRKMDVDYTRFSDRFDDLVEVLIFIIQNQLRFSVRKAAYGLFDQSTGTLPHTPTSEHPLYTHSTVVELVQKTTVDLGMLLRKLILEAGTKNSIASLELDGDLLAVDIAALYPADVIVPRAERGLVSVARNMDWQTRKITR